jgi:hypothetical protein
MTLKALKELRESVEVGLYDDEALLKLIDEQIRIKQQGRKRMKLSEVISEIENGSTRTYEAIIPGMDNKARMKANKGYYHLEIFNDKGLIGQDLGGGAFNGNIMLDYDWRPKPKYVSWQEALKAMGNGENIFCDLPEQTIRSNEIGFNVTQHMIKYGVWGIE